MPRKSREKSNSKVYHVIVRGINKQDIFLDEQDNKKFIKEIKRVKEKYQFQIYAYALMKNHAHFIIYDVNNNLSSMMQSLSISYSLYFNKKYQRIGHVFENRFKSYCINEIDYLKNLVRYIHKNPENAGYKPYKWTSYFEYIEKRYELINPQQVLKVFYNDINNFKYFHDNYIDNNDEYNLKYEMVDRMTDEEAIKTIKKLLNETNLIRVQNYERKKKIEVIDIISKIGGITTSQISRITGISLSTIKRIKMSQKGQMNQK